MDVDAFTKVTDSKTQRFEGVCFHCGKKGHMVADGWSKAGSQQWQRRQERLEEGQEWRHVQQRTVHGEILGKHRSKGKFPSKTGKEIGDSWQEEDYEVE